MVKDVTKDFEREEFYRLVCAEIDEEVMYNKVHDYPDKNRFRKSWEDKNFIRFIDVEENMVRGIINAYMFEQENEVRISGLFVEEQYRRKGIAYSLLEKVLSISKERNIEKVSLTVFSNNKTAIELYENLKFKEISRNYSINI